VQEVQKWIDTPDDDGTFSRADQGHVNTAQVEELVLEKQHTVQDLSTTVELSMTSVHSTVHEELGYSKVCAW
jgi:hypothetical protein